MTVAECREIRRRFEGGARVADLKAELGVRDETVRSAVRRGGGTTARRAYWTRRVDLAEARRLARQVGGSVTVTEVARRLGVSRPTAMSIVLHFGGTLPRSQA